MALRRQPRPRRITARLLLSLVIVVVVWVAVDPEAHQWAKNRWQAVREWWRQSRDGPHPERSPEGPQPAQSSATTPASPASTWAPGHYSRSFTYAGQPLAAGYPNSVTILTNSAFVVAYDEKKRNPAWAAYRIHARRLSESFPRPSRFEVDDRTRSRVSQKDFTRSGFDRGHMVPNHAIASRFGVKAQRETFLMTNVVPQSPALNQGPWRLLEEAIADRAAVAFEEVWVIVGPIYQGTEKVLPSGIHVPDAFFCVIVDELPSGPRMQAFVMTQDTPRQAHVRDFLTSADNVERSCGWNFFGELPDELESIVEAEALPYWLE